MTVERKGSQGAQQRMPRAFRDQDLRGSCEKIDQERWVKVLAVQLCITWSQHTCRDQSTNSTHILKLKRSLDELKACVGDDTVQD